MLLKLMVLKEFIISKKALESIWLRNVLQFHNIKASSIIIRLHYKQRNRTLLFRLNTNHKFKKRLTAGDVSLSLGSRGYRHHGNLFSRGGHTTCCPSCVCYTPPSTVLPSPCRGQNTGIHHNTIRK